jgi:hypothetical protein
VGNVWLEAMWLVNPARWICFSHMKGSYRTTLDKNMADTVPEMRTKSWKCDITRRKYNQ